MFHRLFIKVVFCKVEKLDAFRLAKSESKTKKVHVENIPWQHVPEPSNAGPSRGSKQVSSTTDIAWLTVPATVAKACLIASLSIVSHSELLLEIDPYLI